MFVVVSYDVKTEDSDGRNRLRRISNTCRDYGQRVQYSVFEINIQESKWVSVKQKMIESINLEKDSLRFYYFGSNWKQQMEHFGQKDSVDFDDPIIL